MKLWKKSLCISSILMCTYFFYSIIKINNAKYNPITNFISLIDNNYSNNIKQQDYNQLIENLQDNISPFKPQLFEDIKFKGLLKNKSDEWVALFQTQDDTIIKLSEGESYESVTVKYTDKYTCLVQVGNVEHRFNIR